MAKETVVLIVAMFVVAVWGLTTIYSLVTKDVTPLAAISPVMLLVCGYLFGVKRNGT